MMAKFPCPTLILSAPTSMTESRGWNFRFALLNGSDTRLTPSTISSPLIRSSSSLLVSPITPMTVEKSPVEMWVRRFWDSIHWISSRIRSSLVFCLTMMTILPFLSFRCRYAGMKKGPR